LSRFRPHVIFIFLAALAGLTACSALDVFNAVVPYDDGATKVASDIAYGEEPRQTLAVYRPDRLTGKAPVIFFIYGGSWSNGAKEDYGFVGNAFASKGYVTVIADYRLVPKVRYPAFVEDDARALAWTYRNIAKYGGDPSRIFVAGHSAGAYNAMMLATDPAFLDAQGLSTGIITAVAGLSGPYDFLPLDVTATREAFDGVEDLPATQPVNKVHAGMPPVFLAYGAADDLVGPKNVRTLARKLDAAGVEHETRIYPDVGHAGTLVALSKPFRSRTPVMKDMLDFFRRFGGT